MEKGQEIKYRVWCDHACHSGCETHTGTIIDIMIESVKVQSNGDTYIIPKDKILDEVNNG